MSSLKFGSAIKKHLQLEILPMVVAKHQINKNIFRKK
jgi:hypothetical protein